jgi:hypothetical protein
MSTATQHQIDARDQRALAGTRQTALAALRAAGPARPWSAEAGRLVAAAVATTLAGAVAVAALDHGASPLLTWRLPGLALLMIAQAVGLWAASAPGRSRLAPLSWALFAAAVAVLVTARAGVGEATAGGWVCSASHVTFGLAPLALVLAALRDVAESGRRALTAGLAVAAAGLFWGEVVCDRGVAHVLTHHLGAAAALTVACLLASRFLLARRSFAP